MYDVPSSDDVAQVIISAEVVKQSALPYLAPAGKACEAGAPREERLSALPLPIWRSGGARVTRCIMKSGRAPSERDCSWTSLLGFRDGALPAPENMTPTYAANVKVT